MVRRAPLSKRRNIHIRLPDRVRALGNDERVQNRWGNDDLMNVDDTGSFVRVLLPVRLEGNREMVFGVWLEVSDDDLRRAVTAWFAHDYLALVIGGTLANALRPWGDDLLGAPASAQPRVGRELPYLRSSTDPLLARVIEEVWPAEKVLEAWT